METEREFTVQRERDPSSCLERRKVSQALHPSRWSEHLDLVPAGVATLSWECKKRRKERVEDQSVIVNRILTVEVTYRVVELQQVGKESKRYQKEENKGGSLGEALHMLSHGQARRVLTTTVHSGTAM